MPRLDLWNNVIGEEGARALANALKGDATLAELYLWDCYIGLEGVGRSAQGKRDAGHVVSWERRGRGGAGAGQGTQGESQPDGSAEHR
jgi:hypothetical protein